MSTPNCDNEEHSPSVDLSHFLEAIFEDHGSEEELTDHRPINSTVDVQRHQYVEVLFYVWGLNYTGCVFL